MNSLVYFAECDSPYYYTDFIVPIADVDAICAAEGWPRYYEGQFITGGESVIFEGRRIEHAPEKIRDLGIEVLAGMPRHFVKVRDAKDLLRRYERHAARRQYKYDVKEVEDNIECYERRVEHYTRCIAEERTKLSELLANPPKGVRVKR